MMKSLTFSPLTSFAAALGLLASPLSSLRAAEVITSDAFTLYFGFDRVGTGTVPQWIEVNGPGSTGTVQGDFTLSPLISSTKASDYGFVFTDGVPTFYDAGAPTWGQFAFSSNSTTFELDLAASYSGAAPGSNYQVKFVITKMSIWGLAFNNQTDAATAFQEITAGHESASDPVDVKLVPAGAASLTPVDNYTLLEWTPDSFYTDDTTQNRSFTITPGRVIDGLTIQGYIEVRPIPEPSTAAMGLFGGGALLLMAGRHFSKK